jgi:hypothetical protein
MDSLCSRPEVHDARAASVQVTEDQVIVQLADGRIIGVPLVWYPTLLKATSEQRKRWELIGGGVGIHWEDLDEDILVQALLTPERYPLRSRQSENPRTEAQTGASLVEDWMPRHPDLLAKIRSPKTGSGG